MTSKLLVVLIMVFGCNSQSEKKTQPLNVKIPDSIKLPVFSQNPQGIKVLDSVFNIAGIIQPSGNIIVKDSAAFIVAITQNLLSEAERNGQYYDLLLKQDSLIKANHK